MGFGVWGLGFGVWGVQLKLYIALFLPAANCLAHGQRLQSRQNHSGHHAEGRRHLRRRAAAGADGLDVLPEDLR